MTFDVFNPVRSFRAAYALFIATPLLVFAELMLLSWITFRIVPPFFSGLGVFSFSVYAQSILAQALILMGAGLPTWNWFRQLRERHQKRLGLSIAAIAIAHFLLLELWCALMTPAISLWLQPLFAPNNKPF